MINILDKIDKLRIERGWTFYKLASESNVSQSTLLNMFSRRTLPSITTLDAICTALGISLSEFFQENNNIKVINNYNKLTQQEKYALSLFINELTKDR